MNNSKVRFLALVAIMGAIAFVLQYFSFGIAFLSPFASFDLSALPEIVGGIILGPAGAVEIIVLKLALILIFKGTSSAFTGEVQNFLLSCAYVLPTIYYYRKHRDRKGAGMALLIGTLVSTFIAIFTNRFLIYPAYIRLYGMTWDQIIGICNAANPFIKNIPTFIVFSVIPFNLISRGVTSIITFLVYKKISGPIHRFIQG